ncbi:MAG: ATP-dependent Clp protease proteolytic subunit [bacterium]
MKPNDQDPDDANENQSIQASPYCEFEIETYKALLDDRIILYNDAINKSVIERIVLPLTTLSQKNTKPIKLLINSPGGSVEDGQMVVDAIITSKAPVITVALGQAMSAAFDIFLAGDKRVVYPNTIIMMHSGSSRFETQTLPQIGKEAELHLKYFERWSTWYASRTKIDQKKWFEMLSTGLNYYFFPDEALKYGIVHEIIQPVVKNRIRKNSSY